MKTTIITVRGLSPAIKEKLRIQAAHHGHSMEAEARAILSTALEKSTAEDQVDLFDRIHAHFAKLGGVHLEIPKGDDWEPPTFER